VRRVLLESWFDLDKCHRLSDRPVHHVAEHLEPVARPKRARLPHAIMAGAILYLVAFGYAIFYNYNVTKSVTLAISTSMLQQLAVLGVIFLFLRWRGDEGEPRSIKDLPPVVRGEAGPTAFRASPAQQRSTHHSATTRAAEEHAYGVWTFTARRSEVSRDPAWPSAAALIRIACCGQLRSASRVAQPSSSAERAVVFAIGSSITCGDSTGRIKPGIRAMRRSGK
jgi:hypothetical protein